MASPKKRRKQDALDRKRDGGRPAAARDGDRRRRIGPLVRETLRRKQSLRDWTIDDGPPPDATS